MTVLVTPIQLEGIRLKHWHLDKSVARIARTVG
jgi:hypothetical protein